jgi:hypothetical protein
LEVLVKSVEASRLTEKASDGSSVTFDVSSSLTEMEHETGQFTLKFSIAIKAQPPVATMLVAGTARITGEEAEIQALLASADQRAPPPVFMRIYQQVYSLLYLLSGSLMVPSPSPGLMNVVRLASPNEATAAAARPEQKPMTIPA